MKTSKEFLYYCYQEIENYILNQNLEGAKSRFDQQIKDLLDIEQKLEYIEYIKKQEMSFYNDGLSQLKIYIRSIDSKIKLSIPPPAKPFEELLIELSDEQLVKLFAFLTIKHEKCTNPFIQTDQQSFNYVFGSKDKPKGFEPIEFTSTNKQWLREIFTGLQKEVKYHTDKNTGKETRELSFEIIRQIPIYFIKDNKKLEYKGKGKDVPSNETDIIKEFLATL